jgi:hypothetical protein
MRFLAPFKASHHVALSPGRTRANLVNEWEFNELARIIKGLGSV